MSRTAVCSALVLRNRPSGESNNEVFLLTAEEGIVRATVFGGPKSKLRSHTAPYNSGKVWIYRDPAKDYGKLNDFDVRSWRPGLRELYERTMAAGGVAETILATHGGGGEWELALSLAEDTLDALETANEELSERLLVHFLWQWGEFLGIQPQIECCSVCEEVNGDRAFWYFNRENSVICEKCMDFSSSVPNTIKLNPGARKWLSIIGKLAPSNLFRYSMDNRSFGEAKILATTVLSSMIGKRLASWDW